MDENGTTDNVNTCYICLREISSRDYVITSNPKVANLMKEVLSVDVSLFPKHKRVCQTCTRALNSLSEAAKKLDVFKTSFNAKHKSLTIDQKESLPNNAKRPRLMQTGDNLINSSEEGAHVQTEETRAVKVCIER